MLGLGAERVRSYILGVIRGANPARAVAATECRLASSSLRPPSISMKHALFLALPCTAFLALGPRLLEPQSPLTRVRDELLAVNESWDRARTGFDQAAFERMLAPDFWVQIGPQRMTRAQFIQEISARRPDAALTRFETELLTLAPEGKDWVAVVQEKLESTTKTANGETKKTYSLWVTRDRFRKDGERWLTLSSEAIGWQSWSGGERPPFDDWEE